MKYPLNPSIDAFRWAVINARISHTDLYFKTETKASWAYTDELIVRVLVKGIERVVKVSAHGKRNLQIKKGDIRRGELQAPIVTVEVGSASRLVVPSSHIHFLAALELGIERIPVLYGHM